MEHHRYFEPNEERTTPVIKKTGVTLPIVLEKFAEGLTVDEVVERLPEITKDQVLACLDFSSELAVEVFTERMKHAKKLADKFRQLKGKPIAFRDADGNILDISKDDE